MSSGRSGRQSVTVEIAGERHVLRADATPEYTRSVAAHVDATIRAVGFGNTLDAQRVSILAALTITDDLFRTREEVRQLRAELELRSARLAELLESAAQFEPEAPESEADPGP